MLSKVSESQPIPSGRIAPPIIIIINNDDPWLVYSFKPTIDKVNIFDHIIELNNPMPKMHHNAIFPSTKNAINREAIISAANIPSSFPLDFLKTNIRINWMAMNQPMCLIS